MSKGQIIDADDYLGHFQIIIKRPAVAILDDINKTIQIREGFLAGLAIYSQKISYDQYIESERWGR